MLTLQESSALKILGPRPTLKEIISLCSSNTSISNFCEDSKNFWIIALFRGNNKLIALAYEPLKEKYWKALVEGLGNGIQYKYYYNYSRLLVENGDYIQLETLLESNNNTDYSQPPSVMIPSFPLQPQTKGWIVSVGFYTEAAIPSSFGSSYEFALCSKDQNDIPRLISMINIMINRLLSSYDNYREGDDSVRVFVDSDNQNNVVNLGGKWDPTLGYHRFHEYNEVEQQSPENEIDSIIPAMVNNQFEDVYGNGYYHRGYFTMYRYPEPGPNNVPLYKEELEVIYSATRCIRS